MEQTAFGMSTVTANPLSIVTASLLAGTLAPAAPPEVAAQVLVELQMPIATAYRCAIAVVLVIATIASRMIRERDM